jgi:hypothetical protein
MLHDGNRAAGIMGFIDQQEAMMAFPRGAGTPRTERNYGPRDGRFSE